MESNSSWPNYAKFEFKRENPEFCRGLTFEQVEKRVAEGAKNDPPKNTTRSVKRIIWDNLFTLFNMLNVLLGLLILSVGEIKNAMFLGIAFCNTFLTIFQEVRAKRTVDSLSILSRSPVTVVREGIKENISKESVVLDDVLYVAMGSQISSDGIVVHCQGFEVDESLLTGESDFILKNDGDKCFSGSFVVSGAAYIQVMAIGQDNYATGLSKNSKYEKKPNSQLMKSLNFIIKVLTFIIIPMGALLFYSKYSQDSNFEQSLLGATAAIIGMIPEGLILLTGIAFSVGTINLGKKKTLAQSMPSIETLARVDVLCLDKTGTITDGSLNVHSVVTVGNFKEKDICEAVCAIINTLYDDNGTSKALKKYFKNDSNWKAIEKLPFSSARKYSGITVENKGSFYLGAPEFLLLRSDEQNDGFKDIKDNVNSYSKMGFRVISVCNSMDTSISMPIDKKSIVPMGLILISDTIRKEAPKTLEFFKNQGVDIKVISGDNPVTVSNAVVSAGLKEGDKYIDLAEISNDSEDVYSEISEKYSVFGRVTPYQKQKLISALKRNGHTVAMVGDGVNDVLALREADCSIAMAQGNDAARHVSDFVLLDSNFESLKYVVNEGRRVVNNIERVACLYLVKTIYSTVLSFFYIFLPFDYPFKPVQLTLIGALMVGTPSFLIALTPSYQRIQGQFLEKILSRALPAAFTIITNVLLFQYFGNYLSLNNNIISTYCVISTGIMCFIILYEVSKPLNIKRRCMLALSGTLFLISVIFFNDFFYLADISSVLNVFMLLILVLIYPVYKLYRTFFSIFLKKL